MQIIQKFFLGIIFITLSWFTYLQLNDPDAIFWTLIYAIASAVPLVALFNRAFLPLTLIAACLCISELLLSTQGAYSYWQHRQDEILMQAMNPDKPYIEEAREFLGSLIALALVLLSHFSGIRLQSQKEETELLD